MGDPNGRWMTRGYIVPFINQAYSSMAKKIKNGSGKNFEAVVEVLNVPIGTTALAPWQSYSWTDPNTQPANPQRGPLAGLFDPLRLWVKTAGALPRYYTSANGPRDTLPHVNPPGITPGSYATIVTFTWMGKKLSITPVAGAIDIQVYGRFDPPRLVKDSDDLLLYGDMTDTLSFAALSLSGVERSNLATLEGYSQAGIADIDNIIADIMRQCEKNPRRLGKMGGCGGTSYGWGG